MSEISYSLRHLSVAPHERPPSRRERRHHQDAESELRNAAVKRKITRADVEVTLSRTEADPMLREAVDDAPMLASGVGPQSRGFGLVCLEKEWAS